MLCWLHEGCVHGKPPDNCAECLRAEVERLRAVLREIKEMTPSHYAREHAIIDEALTQ